MLQFIKSLFKREPRAKPDHYRFSPVGESIPVYEEPIMENKPYIFSGSYKGCKFSPVGEPTTVKVGCSNCDITWWADKLGAKICPSCNSDLHIYFTGENKPVYWRREFCANCGCEFEYTSLLFCSCPGCGNDHDIHTIEYMRIKK